MSAYRRLFVPPSTTTSGLLVPSGYQPPQTEPLRPGQVQNQAGGYVNPLDKWAMLDRFLLLGSESGTYYVEPRRFTLINTANVIECILENPSRVLQRVEHLDADKRLPKMSPALWVFALLTGADLKPDTKHMVWASVRFSLRTASQLFEFASYRDAIGSGWGRGMRNMVESWYFGRPVPKLMYQVLKYKKRYGYTHRDMLRLAKPVPSSGSPYDALFSWITGHGWKAGTPVPDLLVGHEVAHGAVPLTDVQKAQVIRQYGLTREMVPTEWLKVPEVWGALLENMPVQALIRNLGNISAFGRGDLEAQVMVLLERKERIANSRIHPIDILNAGAVYAQGEGVRGDNKWVANPQILDRMADVFDESLRYVPSIKSRLLIGIDVSGSMTGQFCNGMPALRATQAAAGMAVSLLRAQPSAITVLFDTSAKPAPFTSRTSYLEAAREVTAYRGGGTDLTQPLRWAIENKVDVDAVIIFTDNETWAGTMHTEAALSLYRAQVKHPVKLVVCSMTSTGYSVGNQQDPDTLECVGLDGALPSVVQAFVDGIDNTFVIGGWSADEGNE